MSSFWNHVISRPVKYVGAEWQDERGLRESPCRVVS